MRLFVALEIPASVRGSLAALVAEMRECSERLAEKRVRWVRAENLHVTLKFIGEAAEAKLAGICSALATVRSGAPLALSFRGLGLFPNERRPTVLWAGIDGSVNLKSVAEDIDRTLESQGIRRESRPFVAHLTLARFAPPGVQEKLRAALQSNWEREFGALETREFHLIESKLKPSGAEYTVLRSFPFVTEA